MSQKEQIGMLDKFKGGEFNTIVMTSVGEEGLDIPSVDLVIFYEPIPSAIRHIQTRGRTGRQEKGRVIILMAKDTRDEGYRWSAHHKEKRMHKTLDKIKNKLTGILSTNQPTLEKYVPKENVTVLVDHREKGSGIIKELIELGAGIKLESLDHADYILSEKVGIELKKVPDFVDSLIDRRIFGQLRELKKNFERPMLIVEGKEDIYSMRKIHPNAIRGLIATIAVDYGIPMVYTQDEVDTASLLWITARREQLGKDEGFSIHSEKRVHDTKSMQEYIVSSLPNVGPTLAKELLRKFGSVNSVFNAGESELRQAEKIGDKKASEIRKILDEKYSGQ